MQFSNKFQLRLFRNVKLIFTHYIVNTAPTSNSIYVIILIQFFVSKILFVSRRSYTNVVSIIPIIYQIRIIVAAHFDSFAVLCFHFQSSLHLGRLIFFNLSEFWYCNVSQNHLLESMENAIFAHIDSSVHNHIIVKAPYNSHPYF